MSLEPAAIAVKAAMNPADDDISRVLEPPGGYLVWIVVFLELITFGAGIIIFMVQGRSHIESFESGRALLNQPIALVNTLILLTGGWCMANGISRLRGGHLRPASRWIGFAAI